MKQAMAQPGGTLRIGEVYEFDSKTGKRLVERGIGELVKSARGKTSKAIKSKATESAVKPTGDE